MVGYFRNHAQKGLAKKGETYDKDSLQIVFSSTKSVAGIVFGMLVDKGLVNYDDKVAKYWPEFAYNGKQDITIVQVMRHESGLANFSVIPSIKDTHRENIKQNNSLGKIIEQ